MFSFLREFTRNAGTAVTIIVMDEEQLEQPRRYRIRRREAMFFVTGTVVVLSLVLLGLIVFTPVREIIPGYGTTEIKQNARLNSLRLTALQDSLHVQQQYVRQLRYLVMGRLDSALASEVTSRQVTADNQGGMLQTSEEPFSEDWTDHQQPAISVQSMPVQPSEPPFIRVAGDRYLSSIQFPVQTPVSGILTRGFDARTGHYAVDYAAQEGSPVRSIGDGYVIFADWSQDGGNTIIVQHADGFVSVYKHNEQLLKRPGDRVRDRETIATSGNTGEISTGPHVHFELWLNGLAQDPRFFIVGE